MPFLIIFASLIKHVDWRPHHLEAGDQTHEAGVLLSQIRQSGQAAQHSGHSVVINVIKSPHLQ